MSWYTEETGNHQGLVVDEQTGRSVAVTYDKQDAPLVAAAPELLESLRFLTDAAETEPGMAIYRAHIAQAWSLISELSRPEEV